jgi:hypothetical protein
MAEPFRWLGLSRHELQFENELLDKALRVMLYVTHNSLGVFALIVSYKDKRTRNFASGNRVKAFSAVEHAARM